MFKSYIKSPLAHGHQHPLIATFPPHPSRRKLAPINIKLKERLIAGTKNKTNLVLCFPTPCMQSACNSRIRLQTYVYKHTGYSISDYKRWNCSSKAKPTKPPTAKGSCSHELINILPIPGMILLQVRLLGMFIATCIQSWG